MLHNAKNGTLVIGKRTMDYISFGDGKETLIMLPGLGDGLKTVKGTAASFALMYSDYAKRYKVYVFSRMDQLAEGYTTEDMARDTERAMDELDIRAASVIGVSQGGMIAQYLALDHPERVEKLVLAVTAARPNPTLRQAVTQWIDMAKRGDYKGLMIDTAERSYSEAYLQKRRWLFPLLAQIGKPKDFTRFIIQAGSCLAHDAYERLDELKCPTLIIGGGEDRIVSAQASWEIAEKIHGSELIMYDGLGHAAYEEAKDFNGKVLNFLA